ncbi:MAG: T9SS type A sorting domain-containing protein [Bacteroidota bacterium]|nr:T9SS type A sorting domain-containing protein [Bacteroidota bacterium]
MKKIYSLLLIGLVFCASTFAQNTPTAITVRKMATYNAAFDPKLPDSVKKTLPWAKDLGVRRVIVADCNNDGKQEIIATDYSNGGRVHVIAPANDSTLEVIWSSPATTGDNGMSNPRFPQVGDCDGDGNPEIIFEHGSDGKIVFYEWDPQLKTWGTEPAFYIDNNMFKAAGALENLYFKRENFLVADVDGDGRSEIICHGDSPRRDVYILGVENDFPGFAASIKIEGGHPAQTQNGRNWVGGSYWNSIPADIDGDGKLEIVNHHWDAFGFWSIDVKGPDTYVYPDTNKSKTGIYNSYCADDAVSYFGCTAADVNGDGISEIVGTEYGSNFNVGLLSFTKADTGVYIWKGDSASVANRYGVIATGKELAALGNKSAGEFWACVKGDLNKDGKDEIYTGAAKGINVIAIQYKGTGKLTDPNSYTKNLVYSGEGGDVFATYQIYNGRIDTVITAKDTTYKLDPTKIDTFKVEQPFTSYIFADKVDLNKNGKMELVVSEQSVYDSITVQTYNWVDSTKQWMYDKSKAKKIFNPYRKTIRVLEFNGLSGLKDQNYSLIFPGDYKLEQNFPNPFNPTTTLRFTLPLEKKVSLKIYDMLGKEVATLINDQLYKKGKYEMQWNGKTSSGQNAASGNYIARLIFGSYSQSIKMTLLK